MSLIVKNKNSNYSKNSNLTTLNNEYTCIGSYEDKPTNRIYYFLHSNESMGLAGKYDCIVEYDQFKDKTFVVYQDGRKGSNGSSEGVLNFHKSHLITGVNKVEDTLYFTDNLNRPRKIDVEKAKRNEENIKLGPTFQGILKDSVLGSEIITDNTWTFGSLDSNDTINGETSIGTYTSSDGSFRFITEASGSSDINIRKSGIIEAGKYYELSYDIDSSNKDNGLATYTADDDAEQININTTVGTHKTTYYSKNTYFIIKRSSSGADITISNISLKEIEKERIILLGVTNNHPFNKNDNLYLQQFGIDSPSLEGRGYNGYAKAVGIVKPFSKNVTTVTLVSGLTTLTANTADNSSPNFTQNFKSGDYICVVINENPYILEIDYINNDSSLELSTAWHGINITTATFNLRDFNPLLNTDNAIITDTPFFSNAPSSPGGKVLYAEPDDAYSPLISFGSYNDKIKYIDALAHQPKDKPEFSFSRSSLTLNNLIGKFFQFRYRYVYKDGSVSYEKYVEGFDLLKKLREKHQSEASNLPDSSDKDFAIYQATEDSLKTEADKVIDLLNAGKISKDDAIARLGERFTLTDK